MPLHSLHELPSYRIALSLDVGKGRVARGSSGDGRFELC